MTSAGGKYAGWNEDAHGNLTFSVTIADRQIQLSTVTCDAETGLFETSIGLRLQANQLGRHDASQERAVRKAEDFLAEKLGKLL